MGDGTEVGGAARPRAARKTALAVAVLALAACVPTGERPTLEAADTSTTDETVLGEVIERSTTTTADETTTSSVDSTSTTAAVTTSSSFVTTTTAAQTTTTNPPTTTTTKPKPGTVNGSFDSGNPGSSVDIYLRTAEGVGVGVREGVLTGENPVPFSFPGVMPGRYRITITDTNGSTIVRSSIFTMTSGGSTFTSCSPSGCSTVA